MSSRERNLAASSWTFIRSSSLWFRSNCRILNCSSRAWSYGSSEWMTSYVISHLFVVFEFLIVDLLAFRSNSFFEASIVIFFFVQFLNKRPISRIFVLKFRQIFCTVATVSTKAICRPYVECRQCASNVDMMTSSLTDLILDASWDKAICFASVFEINFCVSINVSFISRILSFSAASVCSKVWSRSSMRLSIVNSIFLSFSSWFSAWMRRFLSLCRISISFWNLNFCQFFYFSLIAFLIVYKIIPSLFELSYDIMN